MTRPAQCWGPGAAQHAAGCRPGRPLCRWMRQVQREKYGPCECIRCPWPHRQGWCRSGAADRAMSRVVYGDADEVAYARERGARLAARSGVVSPG